MRTLNDALQRAESLRRFRDSNGRAIEKSEDYQDIVKLADEVIRLQTIIDHRHGDLITKLADDVFGHYEPQIRRKLKSKIIL